MTGPHNRGDSIASRYEILEFIGQGGMQHVYKARDLFLDREVALKTPKNNTAEKRFKRSAVVASRINHPNVAKTFDYLEEAERPYLIEELVVGSDLSEALLKQLKYLDPYLAAKTFHYLAKGIASSHHASVIHRDLKPTNVMVSGGIQLDALKITDFGIAKLAEEELADGVLSGDQNSITSSQTAVGALPYMAPEAIETPKRVTTKADVWSMGAMMYELVTGRKPFGTGLQAIMKIIQAAEPNFPPFMTSNPQFSALSNQLQELIVKCLKKAPEDRPSADDIVQLCGNLYYPVSERFTGVIANIQYSAYGWILEDATGESVFYHKNSVYGDPVGIGDRVTFSKYVGGGSWRAHPVVKLKVQGAPQE